MGGCGWVLDETKSGVEVEAGLGKTILDFFSFYKYFGNFLILHKSLLQGGPRFYKDCEGKADCKCFSGIKDFCPFYLKSSEDC